MLSAVKTPENTSVSDSASIYATKSPNGTVLRLLHTIVCGITLAVVAPGVACAQSTNVHPEIGTKEPSGLINRDLASLPPKEQQAWIHGAMSQSVTVLSASNPKLSACLSEWYFGSGTGKETLNAGIDRYPDMPTSAMIWAVAQRACPAG